MRYRIRWHSSITDRIGYGNFEFETHDECEEVCVFLRGKNPLIDFKPESESDYLTKCLENEKGEDNETT